MNSSLQKNEFFFPRKVYWCACLLQPVEESFNVGEHSLLDILFYIKNFDFAGHNYELLSNKNVLCKSWWRKKGLFFCVWKTCGNCFACEKKNCTATEKENNATVEYNKKKEVYCHVCIKHYMRLMYSYFHFVDFF